MDWTPNYTSCDAWLNTTFHIGEQCGKLLANTTTHHTLEQLRDQAELVSTYASTSLCGNPLSLSDIEPLLQASTSDLKIHSTSEKEALNYQHARQYLIQLINKNTFCLDIATIETVQSYVIEGLTPSANDCGRFRQANSSMTAPSTASPFRNSVSNEDAVFVPPDAKDIHPLLLSLIHFVKTKIEIPVVIRAAIFQRQFFIIQPFTIGNARTARLLTMAILGQAKFPCFDCLSLEYFYYEDVHQYYQQLGLEGYYYYLEASIDFTDWISYFYQGLEHEVSRVAMLETELAQSQQSTLPRLEPHHRKIMDYIDKFNSITQREYGSISERSLASRKLDFERLVSLGMIEAKGVGRGTYYVIARH